MSKRKALYYVVKRNGSYLREIDTPYKASGVSLSEAYRWKDTELEEARSWAKRAKDGSKVYRVVSKKRSAKLVDQRVDVAGLLMTLIDAVHECMDANQQMLDACSKALEIVEG